MITSEREPTFSAADDAMGGSEPGDDIAIVGMACLLPGADSPGQFWENIVHKRNCITAAPPSFQAEWFYDPTGQDADRSYTHHGGFLGDLSRFSPAKYGVMPSSVDGAEPDHFLALRCAFDAMYDAGYPDMPLDRERTGVIVGRGLFFNRGWATLMQRLFVVDQVVDLAGKLRPDLGADVLARLKTDLKSHLPPSNAETVAGLTHSALVGRIANRLDLKGPAHTVDCACASTLVAVDQAMRELRAGRCDTMLAGGAQISLPAMIHILFCYLKALSRSGDVGPLSAHADGTLLGQGVGMLVLKRRSDAERDGHRIYALLKGVGVSSDGKGAGLLAPRTEGQQLCIHRAYRQSGIRPETVELIEAHATGIPLGDATEIRSLRAVFAQAERDFPSIALGSVKSMVGHLIPASGVASLIKTALALYHRVLPPTLRALDANHDLAFEKSPFYLCHEPRPWLHGNRKTPRRAGVNAFGFGGINAHAILEEYPASDEPHLPRLERRWPAELVVISADNRPELINRLQVLGRWLDKSENAELLDVAASCARIRGQMRLAIVAKDLPDLQKKLAHAAKLLAEPQRQKIQDRSGIFWYEQPIAPAGRIAFVFPGEGSQYINMLADVCRHFPKVRRQFDLTDQAFRASHGGQSLGQLLFPQPDRVAQAEKALYQMDTAIAASIAAGRGLADLMAHLGVRPDCIVGHSSGEFAAVSVAGLDRPANDEERVAVIAMGIHQTAELAHSPLVPRAVLTAVGGTDVAALQAIVARSAGRLTIAIDNCPHQVVLAGDEQATAEALAALRGKGGLCQRLEWDRAYHTPAFRPADGMVAEFYRSLKVGIPHTEMWSCVTAAPYPQDPQAILKLAIEQWSAPVRFRETVLAMHQAGVRIFVECGPRGNLSAFIGDTLSGLPHAAVPLDVQRKNGIEQLCWAVGLLTAQGVPVQLDGLYDRRQPRRFDFSVAPPPRRNLDPLLPLDLPVLKISPALEQELRPSSGTIEPAAAGLSSVIPAVPRQSVPAIAVIGASPTGATATTNIAAATLRPMQATPPVITPPTAVPAVQATESAMSLPNASVAVPDRSRMPTNGVPPSVPMPPAVASSASSSTTMPGAGSRTPEQPSLPVTVGGGASRSTPSPCSAPAVSPTITTAVEERARVYFEYQQTMQEFLDLQRRVMVRHVTQPSAPARGDHVAEIHPSTEPISPTAHPAPGAIGQTTAVVPSLTSPPSPWGHRNGADCPPPVAENGAPHVAVAPGLTAPASANSLHAPSVSLPASPRHSPAPLRRGDCFLQHVLQHTPGQSLVAECDLDVTRHPFLTDHTFFGRRGISRRDPTLRAISIMPLAMTLELMAQAAKRLFPERQVTALSHIRTMRWLTFEAPSRRVRMEATAEAPGQVRVTVLEADRDGRAAIAEGVVELSSQVRDLGPPQVPAIPPAPVPPWAERLYDQVLYHGPAFQGVVRLERCDAQGIRAQVREPDPAQMFPPDAPAELILPVALIDTLSQMPGLVNFENEPTSGTAAVVFPNTAGRMEFVARRLGESLTAHITVKNDHDRFLLSDAELIGNDGRVVLRYLQRVEEQVKLPYDMFRYTADLARPLACENISDLFAGVPGASSLKAAYVPADGNKVLMQQLWCQVLARQILSRRERETFAALKTPPLAVVGWLLGRLAAKNVVRLHWAMGEALADVEITADPHGRPLVALPNGMAPHLSLAHKGFSAVAAAINADAARGIGVDLEPQTALSAEVRDVAFDASEHEMATRAAAASGEPLDAWLLSIWAGKEAVGKALGRGVLGGPQNVRAVRIDPTSGRIQMGLAGSMAEAFSEFDLSRPGTARLDTYRRLHYSEVLSLCVLP